MKSVCIIPAREGSKRIPGKNFKVFNGKPIIIHPLYAAIDSNLFDDIFVYTDCQEIKNIIDKEFIIERDQVSDEETLAEMLDGFLQKVNTEYDYICVLLPTAVFTTPIHLKSANNILRKFDNIDSVCPVAFDEESESTHFRNEKGKLQFILTHRDAGQFYFLKKKSFDKNKSLIGDNCYVTVLPSIDINTIDDWNKAEKYFKGVK